VVIAGEKFAEIADAALGILEHNEEVVCEGISDADLEVCRKSVDAMKENLKRVLGN